MAKARMKRLRARSPEREIIGWVEAHDVFDRIDAGVSEIIDDHADLDALLEEGILQENTAQLNMRVPPALKAILTRLARERTVDATSLARVWLAERVRTELDRRRDRRGATPLRSHQPKRKVGVRSRHAAA